MSFEFGKTVDLSKVSPDIAAMLVGKPIVDALLSGDVQDRIAIRVIAIDRKQKKILVEWKEDP